jgi:hypothetical protein
VHPALAADPTALRQAVTTDDMPGIQAWLRQQAAEQGRDPLAGLGARPSDPALRAQASTLAANELLLTALAAGYASRPDPALKARLLDTLERTLQAGNALAGGMDRARGNLPPTPMGAPIRQEAPQVQAPISNTPAVPPSPPTPGAGNHASGGSSACPSEGLVAHFPMDGEVLDVSGRGVTGLNYGAHPTRDRLGRDNAALALTGQDFMEVLLNVNALALPAMTFTAWVRARSEERRVGKECRRLCRSRWSPYH